MITMNKSELEERLEELEIRPTDYSLDGKLLPMRTILVNLNNKWITFDYDERGRVQNEKEFNTEEEACREILNRLINLKKFRKKYNLR